MSKKIGPGYESPLDAMKGPREDLLYVACVQPNQSKGRTDLLATVDVNPQSATFCQIIHRLRTGRLNDELHHSGWNICSSCFGCCGVAARNKLVLPALGSDRIYIADTSSPRSPSWFKVLEAEEMQKFDCSTPHTTHCLASGEIMISCMGDKLGNGKCEYILLDGQTLQVKGTWRNDSGKSSKAKFNYDFWYQPLFDVMVSSEWGAPKVFKTGYHPSHAEDPQAYGSSLNFFKWNSREFLQTIDLGEEGLAPLEVRFLHNPKQAQGFVGCAVNANVFRFFLDPKSKTWKAHKVIDVKPKKVSGWIGDFMQGMITDIIVSLDDRFLYLSNWLHGDVRQYDITNPESPVLTGQVFLGGKILSDSNIKVLEDQELSERPQPVFIKNRRLYGAPQMLQLSLDGKRLYVSTSLFSPWDKQFYPETIEQGGTIVKLDVNIIKGGMTLDTNFLVDFSQGEDGPIWPHEMRYPGGDCTSDIWLAKSE